MKSCAPSQTSTAWNGEAGRISKTPSTMAARPATLPISAYRGTPRAMTATPAGNSQEQPCCQRDQRQCRRAGGLPDRAKQYLHQRLNGQCHDAAQRERHQARPGEAAIQGRAQSGQIVLPLRKQRQHQPPLCGECEFAHRVDQTERHVHLAECGRAGRPADQQREHAIASVLYQRAGGQRQADAQHVAQVVPADDTARATGAAHEQCQRARR